MRDQTDVRAILFPDLPKMVSREQLIALLGEPQDVGKGLRRVEILTYRERTIQCSLKAGRLEQVACYFRPASADMPWPSGMSAMADFSHEMTRAYVETWLESRQVVWRINVPSAGESIVMAPCDTSFCFEAGLLSSIQMTSRE